MYWSNEDEKERTIFFVVYWTNYSYVSWFGIRFVYTAVNLAHVADWGYMADVYTHICVGTDHIACLVHLGKTQKVNII